MRNTWKGLLLPVLAAPLFAGALTLEVVNPDSNPEAAERHAVVVVETTACTSPEKTTITATAEGVAGGKRQSIPLQLIRLSEPGKFAIAKTWPADGQWVLRVVANNPDYHGYSAGATIPIRGNEPDWKAVRRLDRALD
jgi:DNA polymerase III delta subunit